MLHKKEEIEKQFSITYLEQLEFSSEKIIEKIQKSCEKRLKKKACATANKWTNALYGEDLASKKEIKYELRKVHPLIGQGVFSTAWIPSGAYIGEYVGVVKKRNRFKDRKNDYVFEYVIGPKTSKLVIDAREKGNFTRFINHSYSPNIVSKWIIKDSISHVIFCAKENIRKGEQLTYDYGPYYWRRRPYPQPL